MFRKMINAISKPKSVFLRIKDKGYQVFIYILVLGIIMSVPIILRSIIEPGALFASGSQITNKVYHLTDEGIMIENYQLENNDNNIKFQIGQYIFTIGTPLINEIGYVVSLEETSVVTYFSAGQGVIMKVGEVTYQKLQVENLDFTTENSNIIRNLLIDGFINNGAVITMIVLEVYFSNVMNIVFIAVLLALLASLSNKIPLKFSHHFKANVYLTTIYAFVMLILSLFNLGELSLIALLVVYFYHFKVYNSVRLIPTMKGGDKRE